MADEPRRRPKPIHSREMVAALEARGIVPPNCQRIVIDLQPDDVGYLYFETLTDERLLEVFRDTSLQIREKPKE